ncbi:Zinc finger MYM-type protein 1, partial [Stegodyphus mimosarum]
MRCPSQDYFFRKLNNNDIIKRDWLIFSESTGKFFCYKCILFKSDLPGNPNLCNQFLTGFNDWKNAHSRISSHEVSKEHFASISALVNYQQTRKIDETFDIVKEKESTYWTTVLRRVVEVIKFLAERGLAFRGDNEIHGDPSNGNFLGCIDLLAKFDPFLEEHVRRYGNPGRGKVSYLSSTTYEELIILLGSKVLEKIVTEIKEAKYYGITVDSTPDVSHTDQLSIVIRYVSKTGDIYERFLMFVKIEKHDAKYLFDTLISVLENQGIDPKFCRCQSYDNAANMSGVYSGVQTRFREINSAATWVPCGAHSLNLVGTAAAESCLEAVKFFEILQSLYNFFAASPQRWSKLRSLGSKISVKRLSETRWSARYEAVKTLCAHYDDIRGILTNISTSEGMKPTTVIEAQTLIHQMNTLEMVLLTVIWEDLLKHVDIVNKSLQEPGIEFNTMVRLYDSLIQYLSHCRTEDMYNSYYLKAKALAPDSEFKESETRVRKRKRQFDEGPDETPSRSAKDSFKINVFFIVLDVLCAEMTKRRTAYTSLYDTFSFLTDNTLTEDIIKVKAQALVKMYPSDLEENFVDEYLIFSNLYPKTTSITDLIKLQIKDKLVSSFPNVNIALRIYLSILGSNAEGERSFSKLKLIKNFMRSTMGQERTSSLGLLCIENTAKNVRIHTVKSDTVSPVLSGSKSIEKHSEYINDA